VARAVPSLVALALLFAFHAPSRADDHATAPKPLPVVDGLDLGAHHNEVLLLDFWASWCPPCRKSFPWMREMQAKYGERGFAVVTVNVDRDSSAAAGFLEKERGELEVVFDPRGEIATAFRLKGMPMSFLIDRDGRVRQEIVGFRSSETGSTEAAIVDLLEEPASTSPASPVARAPETGGEPSDHATEEAR
jgi:thiol-disulfide isomerase/thioredoxin